MQKTKLEKAIGMVAKCTVNVGHCAIINEILTPSKPEVKIAEEIVAIFEKARNSGMGQVIYNGTKIEVPNYLNAKQTIERYQALLTFEN